MLRGLLAAVLVAVVVCEEAKVKPFQPPSRPGRDVYIAESFSDGDEAVWTRWIKSEATKDGADADVAKYDGMPIETTPIIRM